MSNDNYKVNNNPRSQTGMTLISMVILLSLVGFVILMAFRIIPIYIDYYNISNTLESIRNEPGSARWSPVDIQKAIQRRFDVGYINFINAKAVKIRNTNSGKELQLVYEDRRPLLYNLDIVAKFDKKVTLTNSNAP